MSINNERMEFNGEIKKINPIRLIRYGIKDDLADFFLVLGIFYNDLKSLHFYLVLIDKRFNGVKQEISPELGEYGGVKAHLERLIVGTIYEFFDFLCENKNILKMSEFNMMYDELNRDLRSKWDLLVGISNGENIEKTTRFGKVLSLIRHNIAYHLSPKEMRRGFIDCFYNDKKHLGNEFAYYSISDNMKDTRFYYCDAAVERAMRSEVDRVGEIKYEEYVSGLKETIEYMNFTLMALLKEYLRQRPYSK